MRAELARSREGLAQRRAKRSPGVSRNAPREPDPSGLDTYTASSSTGLDEGRLREAIRKGRISQAARC